MDSGALRALIALAVACVAGFVVPAARAATPDEIIEQYLATTGAERFNRPHHMRFRRQFKLVPGQPVPEAYVEWIEFLHWTSPPKFRTEGKVGPMMPHGGIPEVHTHVYNGQSTANLYSIPRNESVTIRRGAAGEGIALANMFLSAMGFPHLPEEHEQAKTKQYWLPEAVSAELGYTVDDAPQTVHDVSCLVVRHRDEDVLWFDLTDGAKLLKRDVWRKSPHLHRQVIELYDYQSNGLPRRITVDKYGAAEDLGAVTSITDREEYIFRHLDFDVPSDDLFELEIRPGTSVLDINTLLKYEVQRPGRPPFEALLRGAGKSTSGISPFLWANIVIGGALVLLAGLWCRKRVVRQKT
jgi:hypothetical protein